MPWLCYSLDLLFGSSWFLFLKNESNTYLMGGSFLTTLKVTEQCLETFLDVTIQGGYHCHLVGRDQGCHQTSPHRKLQECWGWGTLSCTHSVYAVAAIIMTACYHENGLNLRHWALEVLDRVGHIRASHSHIAAVSRSKSVTLGKFLTIRSHVYK